ncbi:uncharacterized protein STEHIDRAFT_125780, partial [Stereum hirsutum FP-91666 SS1]|uniref:uncharacterized protein n=1 Tax=Stereum hirsutum (strain FP-91666) TaxID=721885 RepID=UPI0004449A4F
MSADSREQGRRHSNNAVKLFNESPYMLIYPNVSIGPLDQNILYGVKYICTDQDLYEGLPYLLGLLPHEALHAYIDELHDFYKQLTRLEIGRVFDMAGDPNDRDQMF